ncbi:ABC transporter substrate-binding protein [soil metagenome]
MTAVRRTPLRRPTGRRRVAATAVVALSLVASACGGGEGTTAAGDGDLRAVTLVLDWTPNTNHAGLYVAQAEGWYRDAGLDVEIIQPGESGSLPMLGSGRADVAITVSEELIPARAEGVPVVSIAAVIEHNTSSLVGLSEDGIDRPADLAGLKYGGFGGQLETELVRRMVECDGGDPDEVDFVEVGNVDYRVGLARDFYDFVWIFDGWDGIRLSQLQDVDIDTLAFIDHTDCIPDWYTPVIATTEDLVADDPALLGDFMEATARGYRVAIDDPAAAADALLEGAPELDEELVERSAEYLADRYADDSARWGHQEPGVWADFTDFLVDAGLIEEAIDTDDAFTNQFLPDQE